MAKKSRFAETFSHGKLKEELESYEEIKLEVNEYEKILKYDEKEFMEMLGEARYEEILKEVENIPLEYDKENTKQYDLLLNRILNGSDGMIGDSFLTEEEKESIGKRMTGSSNRTVRWHWNEDSRKVFELSFKEYSFERCFKEVLIQLFGPEKLAAEILWGQYSPENYYEADKRMAAKISRGFRDWLSMLNWENVFGSMTKEILFAILNNSKIYKKDSREVEIDLEQGCYLLDKNGSRGEKLWEIQREPHGKVEIEGPPMIRLNQYFSPVYQIKISLAKYEKSFMLKLIKDQYTKNFQFEFLINEVWRFDRGISYSEQYMTELQTGIFTAWKLYRIVCGLLLPESSDKGSQNKESPNKELLKKITVLAESVGSIHNLELRLYLLDVVDIRIQELQKEISGDLYLGLEKIAKDIKKEAEEYNQKTEIIYKLFLYLYREEEQWKDLLGLLNMPTKQFSALLNEVRILSTENHVKSYRQNQYDQLYYADAKRDRHKLYSVIRKGLEKGQGWLRLPERE